MKKSVFTYSFSIIFLIIVIVITSAVVQPIVDRVSSEFEKIRNSYISLLEERIGLRIEYDSLSPSVFSGFRMVNIKITDIEKNASLISIDSIRLRWNILKLLSDNPADALGELVVTGLKADYDYLEDNDIIQNILNAFQPMVVEDVQREQEAQVSAPISDDFQTAIINILDPIFNLPIDVMLKNTTLTYSSAHFDFQSFFSKITVSDDTDIRFLNLLMNGRLTVISKGDLSSFGHVSTRISLSGRITRDLESSFAQVRISSIQDSDYIIPRLDIHSSFTNNTVKVVALQNISPFSIEFESDLSAKNISIYFNAENFKPLTLISYQGENELVHDLKDTTISGRYSFFYNWDEESIAYDANGHITVSPLLIGESLHFEYTMYGDEEVFSIEECNITSKSVSVGYSGSINIQTLIPEGVLDIRSITVPSGNTVSSEVYIDSFENELLIFAPQIHLGDKTLTAFHLDAIRNNDSLDFTFEVSDYSRAETFNPGVISANGSYDFGENKFLQLEVLSESLFLDSITEIILWYLPKEQAQSFAVVNSAVSPYIFSFNAFFTSDFNSYSYSLPYAIVANTQRDDEFLLFSANGNESLFQLPSFSLVAGGQSVQAEISGDLGDNNSEIFFNSSIFINSIPYTFSGAFVPDEYVTVSGDYNANLFVNFLDNNAFYIESSAQSLPISIQDFLLSVSLDTSLTYNSPSDWIASINSFDIENVSTNNILGSRLNLVGNINTNGMFFDRLSYSDELSTLDGILASSWNISNAILENITFNLSLEDSFSNEKYELNLEAFNLLGAAFGDEFLENMFFSADALIQDSPTGRFANFQSDTNTINAQLTAQGSLENPSASLSVDNASFMLDSQSAEFSGSISLEDYEISANNVDIKLGEMGAENVVGSLSLTDFSGSLNGIVSGRLASTSYFAEKTFHSPVELSLISLTDNADLPLSEKAFQLSVVFEKINSTFLPERENYAIELLRTPGRFDITAGETEVVASLLDSGEISVSANEGFFVQFDGYGILDNDELTMFLDNIYADASDFSRLVDLPVFSLHSGIAVGSGTLSGPLNDLQINANLQGTNLEISVPDYVGERLICADFPVTVSQNIFSSEKAFFTSIETQTGVHLDVELSLEQLVFTYLSLDIETLNDEYVLGKYGMPYGSFDGLAQTDLFIYVGNELVEVRGDIVTKDTEAIIMLADSADLLAMENSTGDIGDVVVDLRISIQNQSQLYFPSKTNPIIRGLVNQTEPLLIQMDSRYATSLISGEFDMKGGEILYLNRTFFAREATAIFNDSVEDFDPLLTANAEIRERDEDGDPVRIILSVENQRLTQLDPRFESIPSMSEQEIMTLLGQIILGSSEDVNPLVLLGGLADYGTQVAVFRGIEDSMRDFLNLDIFSFRTMFLQNAVINLLDNTTNEAFTAGNFLDSTTVYVGKFLNETLYADAMLSLVYDNDRQDLGLRGLVFQPEFGLELPSPFATIRWSIAPDLTTDWNLLVPFTSISLSWKFDL